MLVCCLYLLAVILAFVVGVVTKDDHGVSFIPTAILTLPFSFLCTVLPLPDWIFSGVTAFYDLPLFLASALLNICLAELIRRIYVRASN
jgi:hypothetical protein